MAPVPVDDLRAGGGPHALALHDMAQRRVQAADAERLADEPGVQVQHQQPPVGGPLVVQGLEGLLDHLPIPVDINAPVPQGIDIVQRQRDGQGVQLALGDFQGIGLLVVDPVADIADARLGQQLRRPCGLPRLRAQPADGGCAGGAGQGFHGGLDVVPLLLLRHPAGDHAVDGDAVRDDLAAAAQAMAHQERIVLGGEGIHGDRRLDAVPVQHIQDAEDADAVAILAMRPGGDVGEGARAIAAGEVGQLVAAGRAAPFHVLEGDDDAQGHAGVPRPSERRAAGIQGRPVIMVVVHAIAQLWERRNHARRAYGDSLLVDACRMGHRLLVVVRQVVLGDLVGGGLPHPSCDMM